MNAKAVAAALRALADAIEAEPDPSVNPGNVPTFYTRQTSPLEARAWDRMLHELAPAGRALRPGRQIMVSAEDVHEWMRRQAARQPAADDDGYAEFAVAVRARQRRGAEREARISLDSRRVV